MPHSVVQPQLPISLCGELTFVQKLKWLVFTDWSWHIRCIHAVRIVDVQARCWLNQYLPENTPPLVSITAEDVSCLTATHRWSRNNKDLPFLDILAESTRSQITATELKKIYIQAVSGQLLLKCTWLVRLTPVWWGEEAKYTHVGHSRAALETQAGRGF